MRQATWNKIENHDISGCTSIDDILVTANLDYNVVKKPAKFRVKDTHYTVPDQSVTFVENDPTRVFGIVGSDFTVYQNRDAFNFLDNITDMNYLKAGTTASGLVYVIGQAAESVKVLGDEVHPHIIFQNGFNGAYALKANICMLRCICQNQFNAAFKNASNAILIRHSKNMVDRIRAAEATMQGTLKYIDSYRGFAEEMATKRITPQDLQNVIKQCVLDGKEQENDNSYTARNQERRILEFTNAYNTADNANFVGTAWGIINAFTDVLTHQEPIKSVSEKYYERQFMDATINDRKLKKLITTVKSI